MVESNGLNTILFTYQEGAKIKIPERAYNNDTGFDLACSKNTMLERGVPAKIPTGIQICPPDNLWCRIVGRSSTIWRYHVQMLEGIIDTGWRGELFMVGIYHGDAQYIIINHGTRLAQLIFHERTDVQFKFVDKLPDSARGSRGFGSSGE